jgi:membrane protein YdbS with pleckstrin-like domain
MYCLKCGREIEESSQYCKYCGTRLEGETLESESERLKESGDDVPTYERPKKIPLDTMEKNERIVFETHPSKIGVFSNHIAGALLFIAGGSVVLIVLNWEIFGAILIITGLIIALIGYLKWRSIIYGLTTNRIIVLKGIFSKDIYENRLDRVQDIRVKISLWQRVFNYGDIFLTTAGTSGIECIWHNIPDPRKKQKLLRTLLTK